MARKKSLWNWTEWLLGILVSVAIAGLFLNGVTLANPILGYIPKVVHAIVGWGLIVKVVIADVILKFAK